MTQKNSKLSFKELDLNPSILKALSQKNFHYATEIQQKSLPHSLAGKDIAGQAQTGTGKTMAFLIAAFNRLLNNPKKNKANQPRVLILAPTRELAVQIGDDANIFTKLTALNLCLAYGGDGYDKQLEQINNGVDVLVGTTGRVIDYVKQGIIDLSQIEVLILDEADRMFDLGFIKDIRYLIRKCPTPQNRLTMLFSATLSAKVREMAYEDMNDPVYIEIAPEQKTNENIIEELFYPSADDKMQLLLTLIEEEWPDRAIVFANTKVECEQLYRHLLADRHRVGLLTGDISQNKRLAILESFTKGDIDILVATDVAARGLHIPEVTLVFNYDLPDDREDYVHRIGRTGRAGAKGHSISFACEKYAHNLSAIEDYINHKIPVSHYDSKALLTLPKIRRHYQKKRFHKK